MRQNFIFLDIFLIQSFLNDAIETVWVVLTSRFALYFYVITLMVLIVLIILFIIVNELKRQSIMENLPIGPSNSLESDTESPLTNNETEENEETKETENRLRFFMLNELDRRAELKKTYRFKNEVTLQTLCEEFRQFSAYKLGLYYDISDIRRFIGGLGVSHIMILQGMSGTGKTSLAYAFGDYLANPTTVVPIQPMWKERTDLIGYYNEFTKKFNETTLLQKLYVANHDDQMYITVLDEMNIARVEYYFAEFLSLLELPDHNKRHLDVISDVWESDPSLLTDGKLVLPKNMWFIGTANNDDSTFSISDKVYDRAMVLNLDKKAKAFVAKPIHSRSISTTHFIKMVKTAQEKYALSERNKRRIQTLDKYLMKHYQITFGNRIMKQIYDYVPIIIESGGSELSALDDVISKKVLRKLETKNMVYVKNSAPGLIAFIEELFGENTMELCVAYIKNIEINV